MKETLIIKEVIIDTETTGLNIKSDKIIEIGAIELINKSFTGKRYHSFFNPWPIKVNKNAIAIHGLNDKFLRSKPIFKDEINNFLEFIKNSKIIAHNIKFDLLMLNKELEQIGYNKISNKETIDTLKLARILHPSGSNTLDSLCKRYKININEKNRLHSALKDSELLARIYLCMIKKNINIISNTKFENKFYYKFEKNLIKIKLSKNESLLHDKLIKYLGNNSTWNLIERKKI